MSSAQWSLTATLTSLNLPLPTTPPPHTPLPYFHLLTRLKTTKRQGWVDYNVKHTNENTRPESISDHMHRMSLICLLAPAHIDAKHAVNIAIVHDLAEAIVGDITPHHKITKIEKNRREKETMEYIATYLLGGIQYPQSGVLQGDGKERSDTATTENRGAEIMRFWQEYEDAETPTSKFVHDVDKFEMLLQMDEYEKEQGLLLEDFANDFKKIQDPTVKSWALDLLDNRSKRLTNTGNAES